MKALVYVRLGCITHPRFHIDPRLNLSLLTPALLDLRRKRHFWTTSLRSKMRLPGCCWSASKNVAQTDGAGVSMLATELHGLPRIQPLPNFVQLATSSTDLRNTRQRQRWAVRLRLLTVTGAWALRST